MLSILFSLLFGATVHAQELPVETTPTEPAATERIHSFDSEITIAEDGELTVTETIEVTALGEQIRRGIFRDFPTVYDHPTWPLLRTTTTFDVVEVLRDGVPEPYNVDNVEYGKRLYIGDEDVFLEEGRYTYTITYRTKRQMAYNEGEDTLWWNVTGNGWVFLIDDASATIRYPEGITFEELTFDGYTGAIGSTEQNVEFWRNDDDTLLFTTTQGLYSYEGLTVAVGLPEGAAGSAESVFLGTLRDNIEVPLFIILVIYYFTIWFRKGRDPKKGTIIPIYEPPHGLSPAAMRYVDKMHHDKKSIAASVINMGVKGFLKIEKSGKHYTLTKVGKGEKKLSEDERKLAGALFTGSNALELKQKHHAKISGAIAKSQDVLTKAHLKKHFNHNSAWIFPGVLMTAGILALPWWIYSVPSSGTVLMFVIAVVLNIVFGFLLYAPTVAGRKIMDEIEGFKWFLSVTEKERLEFAHPPKQTPELFEKYLPYALALGVENKWAKQFATVFEEMEKAGNAPALGWYTGMTMANFGSRGFAHSFGSSLSSTISSSAAAPSSGGGVSGGGFSGGGGGGGGGGGW